VAGAPRLGRVPGRRPGQHRRVPAAVWRHAAAAPGDATNRRADADPPTGHALRLHAWGSRRRWPAPGCAAARHADARAPRNWTAPAQRRQPLSPSRCEAAPVALGDFLHHRVCDPPAVSPVYMQSPHAHHTPHRPAPTWAGPSPHAVAAQLNTPHYFMRKGYRESTALASECAGTSPSNKTSERAPPPPPLIQMTPQRSQAIPTGAEFATYAMAGYITPTNQRYIAAQAAAHGQAAQKPIDIRNVEAERHISVTPKPASGSKSQVSFTMS